MATRLAETRKTLVPQSGIFGDVSVCHGHCRTECTNHEYRTAEEYRAAQQRRENTE